jgi:hypothetical protein
LRVLLLSKSWPHVSGGCLAEQEWPFAPGQWFAKNETGAMRRRALFFAEA